MTDLVTLSFDGGNCASGFAAVTVRLWNTQTTHSIKTVGSLSAASELVECYRSWKLLYLALSQRLNWAGRIKISEADVTNVSIVEFHDLCQRLVQLFNHWLSSASFRPIDQQLRTHLNPSHAVQIVVETCDRTLACLPWHQWQLLEDFPHAEVALSTASYQQVTPVSSRSSTSRIKILAILGCSDGITLEQDQQYLESLSDQADIKFLVEPSLEALHHHLWEGCHLLFFAGHSSSEGQGVLQLSSTRSLSLEQVKYALKGAIRGGLQLAIFNSCDGLALAQSLAELNMPQVIVMREPVPDPVAQQFLKHFLTAFTSGQDLYTSVRSSRERLQALEETYPCASWLPMLCQNPAEPPCMWHDWLLNATSPITPPIDAVLSTASSQQQNEERHSNGIVRTISHLLAVTVGVTALVGGLRWMGWLQTWELQAFDQLVQLRPEERPDPRLLVIAIDEADFQLEEQSQRKGSLSDLALQSVLETILPLQPRSIGLDIYRDFAVSPDYPQFSQQLIEANNFFSICKVSDPSINHPGVAPPPEIPLEQQGFSDVVKDPDNVLRRHLLVLNPSPDSPCVAPYALSAQLALHYLAAEGVTAQYTANGDLQIGGTVFKQLQAGSGPYTATDLWGYQILLNYRSYQTPANIVPVVTLSTVLNGQLRLEDVRDRIVLIGVNAESAEDFIATPYRNSAGNRQLMPGVILQAQMVSQIISAVKDDRTILQIWPLWADLLWIMGWAWVGGVVALLSRTSVRFMLIGGLTLVVLYFVCFVVLMQGFWVPLVPSAVAMLLTSGILLRIWRLLYSRKN